MLLTSYLLILNIITSFLHPAKHIPQIIHTLKTKKVEDLSKTNIICELIMNLMHLTSFSLIYIYIGKKNFFIPMIIEKVSSTILVGTILYLKIKYTIGPITFEELKPIKNYNSLNNNNIENI